MDIFKELKYIGMSIVQFSWILIVSFCAYIFNDIVFRNFWTFLLIYIIGILLLIYLTDVHENNLRLKELEKK